MCTFGHYRVYRVNRSRVRVRVRVRAGYEFVSCRRHGDQRYCTVGCLYIMAFV